MPAPNRQPLWWYDVLGRRRDVYDDPPRHASEVDAYSVGGWVPDELMYVVIWMLRNAMLAQTVDSASDPGPLCPVRGAAGAGGWGVTVAEAIPRDWKRRNSTGVEAKGSTGESSSSERSSVTLTRQPATSA